MARSLFEFPALLMFENLMRKCDRQNGGANLGFAPPLADEVVNLQKPTARQASAGRPLDTKQLAVALPGVSTYAHKRLRKRLSNINMAGIKEASSHCCFVRVGAHACQTARDAIFAVARRCAFPEHTLFDFANVER
jgi:hypothetical protein